MEGKVDSYLIQEEGAILKTKRPIWFLFTCRLKHLLDEFAHMSIGPEASSSNQDYEVT